jgi:hypothetical protein
MAKVWKIAPGAGADDWDVFRARSCIGLGWLPSANYRNYKTKGEVLRALK